MIMFKIIKYQRIKYKIIKYKKIIILLKIKTLSYK